MAAVFLELAEKWRYEGYTLAVLLLLLCIVARGVTRLTFLAFLGLTTVQFLWFQFPEVANHVNLEIYCNILLISGIGYTLIRRREYPTDDDCFEAVRPVLQGTTMLMYALAGFHKLNTDFLSPAVSCVGTLASQMWDLVGSDIGGLPIVVALGAITLPITYQVSSAPRVRWHLPWLGRFGLTLLAALGLVVLSLQPELLNPAGRWAITATSVMVLCWELGGGLLLGVPRLQWPIIAFSLVMHSAFALIGFVDFGALALALLFTFVPPAYYELLNRPVELPGVRRPVSRIHLYLAVALLAGVISYWNKWTAAGQLFLLAELFLVWPILTALTGPTPTPAWSGVSLRSGRTPAWMLVFPVVLLLHGLTPYLGLRTAGNFSMFSNLKTEGARSNHLLLGSNPLKVWHYQEDAVRVISIDDRKAKLGYAYEPLQGYSLPVVEFRKQVHKWTLAGRTVPMTFEYRGRVYQTEDIASDPVWRTTSRDWEMRLLDFRRIDPDGLNRCRW